MKKKEGKIEKALKKSPINYFSDLFIVAMVLMWIFDNLYQTVIATIVTIKSLELSAQVGYSCIDVSMWGSIGSNIAVPLGAGGAIWMIKNSVQHAIAYNRGEQAHQDFPRVNADGEMDGNEPIMGESEVG